MKASIVIPSFNACERLYYNLLALSRQTCSSDRFEVIVVDNASIDCTADMLSRFKADFSLKIITLKENKGRSYARNCGIKEAKGEIIIFHDSDMIAEKEYVKKHIEAHIERHMVVCGQSWNRIYSYYYKGFKGYLEENLKKQLYSYNLDSIEQLNDRQPLIHEEDILTGKCFDLAFELEDKSMAERYVLNRYGCILEGFYFPWSLFITNNCSVDRCDITSLGGFDVNFVEWGCEDTELGYRLYKKGCRFIKLNSISSLHQEHPVNFMENGLQSLYYFTRKYDCIDLIIFYYGYLLCLNRFQIDQTMLEVEKINSIEHMRWLLDIYKEMLIVLRDKNNRKWSNGDKLTIRLKNLRTDFELRYNEIDSTLSYLLSESGYEYFVKSFKELAKKTCNIKF